MRITFPHMFRFSGHVADIVTIFMFDVEIPAAHMHPIEAGECPMVTEYD